MSTFASDHSLSIVTEKKEKILHSALQLFAKDGYKATSTSKVARQAGVSEGLIFRHFENKEGLLEAIMKEAECCAKTLFAEVIFEPDPQAAIRNYLTIPLKMRANPEELEFWKLQYKIKWETEHYGEQKMEPVLLALSSAFEKLGYASPELEAKTLLLIIDGFATQYFLQDSFDLEGLINFLKNKYGV
jgi:AcrR family transcriptional regulator